MLRYTTPWRLGKTREAHLYEVTAIERIILITGT